MTMVAFVDHEEVGSQTYSGAGGTFLAQTVERLLRGLGLGEDKISQIKANSIMISADAGHGIHPNYPDKHDPDAQPMVGGGPLIKVNAQHRYSTDGWGLALWDGLCRKAGVEYQIFVSNNSVRCGTTIGPILAAGIGVSALDVGVPILAMHSARELCAPSDVNELRRVFEVFFSGGPR
jgi:aspartyl aminopeptidase